jgi:hypothetical protein
MDYMLGPSGDCTYLVPGDYDFWYLKRENYKWYRARKGTDENWKEVHDEYTLDALNNIDAEPCTSWWPLP